MQLAQFDYELPESLIAKFPAEPRDHARLLVVHKNPFRIEHRRFFEIVDYLKTGDLLISNNTRVLPARVEALRQDRPLEVLFLKQISTSPLCWSGLCRNTKRLKPREKIQFPGKVEAAVASITDGQVHFEFDMSSNAFLDWLHTVGRPPLPPYIDRTVTSDDFSNYQTVFAKHLGAVAAPTAGLHFTPGLLEGLKTKGIPLEELTLHVGYGTFSPIREADISKHRMHEESYSIPDSVLQQMSLAKGRGNNVVAVGTTTLRALESMAKFGQKGNTDIFIKPGFQFQSATGLITNFHLPQSTLLILVSAFLGLEETRSVYQEAVSQQYRFFSYGDAMLILPS